MRTVSVVLLVRGQGHKGLSPQRGHFGAGSVEVGVDVSVQEGPSAPRTGEGEVVVSGGGNVGGTGLRHWYATVARVL